MYAVITELHTSPMPCKDQYEIIVVDNNSTDNTREVCMNFIEQHPEGHFYYLEERRQGASFARNTGAEVAKSPLLCFMDDDEPESNKSG